MRVTFLIPLLISASALALPGCNTPRGAGNAGQILRGAEAEDADFAVVAISRESVARIGKWPGIGAGTATNGWIKRARGPASNLISAGDRIDLTIWETGDAGLLAAPGQQHIALPGLTVSPDGSIYLPYAEKVYIGNMTPDEARQSVQKKLVAMSPSAQVLIAHQPGRKSTVDLVSGVASPGTYPLPDRDFTVLSLLAAGGGIPASMKNPMVRLMRDGKLYGINARQLMESPASDTTLRGGDKVYVEDDQRYFLTLGASRNRAQVPFSQERISALDALSLSGGLNDARANAKGVLVLRDYPASALRADGSGPPKDRVIFTLDLTTADGLFSAGQFQIQNKDVVMVTETPIGSALTVVSLMRSLVSLGSSVDNLGN